MISQRYRMLLLKLSVGMLMLSMMMSCFGEPEFPKEPAIEYSWIENNVVTSSSGVTYDSVYIGISFRDGDGDLGLSSADTLYPYGPYEDDKLPQDTVENKYRNNYFVTVLRKEEDGDYHPVIFENNQSFDGRFPILNNSGRDRPLEGELRYGGVTIFYDIFDSPIEKGDSIKFRVHIADRALNESNEVITNGIEIGTPKEKEEENTPPPVEGD